MNLEKVFNRKQVKKEAEKIRFTLGQMQDMFNDYGIQVFNTETNELEIATMHTATTADLLSVIKYYEDNLTKVNKAVPNKIAGIIWEKRYSTTEADDRFGRWMRIGRINEMTVAIITKAVHLEKVKYVVKLPNDRADESLQSNIMVNSENEAMLEAEKFIAGYVANFRKIEVIGK